MGVDTRGLIRPNTTESEVLEYLNNRFKNVKSFLTQDADRQVGFIGFEDGEDKRQLFFISKSYDEDFSMSKPFDNLLRDLSCKYDAFFKVDIGIYGK